MLVFTIIADASIHILRLSQAGASAVRWPCVWWQRITPVA
jgi:hypothetical protein